jgi:hypothetical protein
MEELLRADAHLRERWDAIICDRLISLFPTFPWQQASLPVIYQ